jgi:hypothetical protein
MKEKRQTYKEVLTQRAEFAGKWRAKNKEKVKETNKKYYEANKAKWKKYKATQRAKNKDT